jgi:glyoxylate/hydroxypyruvate reductase
VCISSFGITDCVYTSNPSSPRNTTLEATSAAWHSLRSIHHVDADELTHTSDVLFVLVPSGDATPHVVNAEYLCRMKKHAVLVNTSRSTLIDSDALTCVLREEWIWSTGLDVIDGESPHWH